MRSVAILLLLAVARPAVAQSFEGLLEASDTRTQNAGPYDLHAVTMRAFQQAYVRVESSQFRPYFLVQAPSGALLESPVPTTPGTFFDAEFFASENGVWKFYVTSPDVAALGAYRLDVVLGPLPRLDPIEDRLGEGDAMLVKGEWVDAHVRTWSATTPFHVSLAAAEFCGYLLLQSPAGREYRAGDACTEGRPGEVRLSNIAPETGEWRLFVTSDLPGKQGPYRVTAIFPSPVQVNR